MKVIGILAHDLQNGIGKNNNLPWHCKADLQFFKQQTLNETIIMGHNTFKSLPKLLPKRNHIIISKNLELRKNKDILVYSSLEECLKECSSTFNHSKVFLIGGAFLFNYALKQKLINELLITKIPIVANCDTFLDSYDVFIKEAFLIKKETATISREEETFETELSFFNFRLGF
jgi:dihydrofolate reductase